MSCLLPPERKPPSRDLPLFCPPIRVSRRREYQSVHEPIAAAARETTLAEESAPSASQSGEAHRAAAAQPLAGAALWRLRDRSTPLPARRTRRRAADGPGTADAVRCPLPC